MSVVLIAVCLFLFSTITALLLVKRKKLVEKQTKILLFALYFWLLVFAQLMVVAISYMVLRDL